MRHDLTLLTALLLAPLAAIHAANAPKLAKIKISLEGIEFKDPVLIDLFDGQVYDLENFGSENGRFVFDKLPMADYPFSIVEKHTIKTK